MLSSGEDRLNMCNIVSNKIPNVHVCDHEIKHNLIGEPYDILTKILTDFKNENVKYYFAMGLDNANTIHTWPNYNKVINLLPFVIFSRVGISKNPFIIWYNEHPHMYIDSQQELDISSTKFKQEYLKFGKSDLVDSDVLKYIKDNSLYL